MRAVLSVTPSLSGGLVKRQRRELDRRVDEVLGCPFPSAGSQKWGPKQRRISAAAREAFGPAMVYAAESKQQSDFLLFFPDSHGGFELDVSVVHRRRGLAQMTIARISHHAAARFFQRANTTEMGALFREFEPWAAFVLHRVSAGASAILPERTNITTRSGASPSATTPEGLVVATTWIADAVAGEMRSRLARESRQPKGAGYFVMPTREGSYC